MSNRSDEAPLQAPHERLLRRLAKLLGAGRRSLLVVATCASPALRARVERELRERLRPLTVAEGDLTGARDPWAEILDARGAAGAGNAAALSFGLPARPGAIEEAVLDRLNLGREHLGREGICLVLWTADLSQEERLRVAAPDLWAHRAESLVFLTAEEFELPAPGDGPSRLLEALREVDATLARSTVVGDEREMLSMMRSYFLFLAGEGSGSVAVNGGAPARALDALLSAANDVVNSGDLTPLESAASLGSVDASARGESMFAGWGRAAVLWARGRVVEATRALAEVAMTQRRWMSGAKVPAFVDRAVAMQDMLFRGDLGRHRTLLAQDVTFDPPADTSPAAVALLWLGAWPQATFARARALAGSGHVLAALRELHALLKTLAVLGARRLVAGSVDILVRTYLDLGLPEEALRVLDLTDRDDLRAPDVATDLLWTRLRATALRASGRADAARDLCRAACARVSEQAPDEPDGAARLHREHQVLQLRALFDDDADVSDDLRGLYEHALAVRLRDAALDVAETLRAYLVRRGRHAEALRVCRGATLVLDDTWGPSAHARWVAHGAQCLLALGRAEEALSEVDHALERWHRDPPPLRALPLRAELARTRSRALAALGRTDEALGEVRVAVALHREEDAHRGTVDLLLTLADLPLPVAISERRGAAREALELARQSAHLAGEARALLALVELSEPKAPATVALRDEALWLARASGDDEALRRAAALEPSPPL